MPRITKRFVDSLKPPTGKSEVVHWDDDLSCFGVRVRASGAATYIVQYRNAERITRKVRIGIIGRMTPDQARSKARQQLAAVDREEDPANERARRRRAKTVEELCRDYLIACSKGLILNRKGEPKKQSTIYTDTGRINRHIVPLLGRRHVEGLAQADVKHFMRDVIAGKTAVVEKTKPRGKAVVTGGSTEFADPFYETTYSLRTRALYEALLFLAAGNLLRGRLLFQQVKNKIQKMGGGLVV